MSSVVIKHNFIKIKNTFKGIKAHGVEHLYSIAVYILLIGLAFVFIYPFLFMLVNSFKSYNDLVDITVKWFPKEFTPSNWVVAFISLDFMRTFTNSIIVTFIATFGHLLSCSFIAYGFARFKFRFSGLLFFFVILVIIVPTQTIIVPQYIMFANYKMIGSYLPLLIPTFLGFGLKGGIFIFLFRQSFLMLPSALEEAAYIDGCNPYYTFFRIILPMCGPTILVCFVLSAVWHWNDYFEPNLYITKFNDLLLPQTLPLMYDHLKDVKLMITHGEIDERKIFNEAVVMAGTALAMLPMLVMYLGLKNKFMQGVERSGLVE
jgi:multiple sugar transport system permease protein